jgi:putative hemolysin
MWQLGRDDGLHNKLLFFPRTPGRKPLIRDLCGLPPSLGRIGSLEVRLATSKKEIRKAQKLRYKVFYELGQASADHRAALVRRDLCPFDRVCDHLLVIDHSKLNRFGRIIPRVVGTYRLLRQDVAERNFGFYSEREFDIAPLLARHRGKQFLELGRSCVLPEFRSKRTLELLWRGIWTYVRHHRIDVMIGCASLEGTNPLALALPLSFLHHHAAADATWTARALTKQYVRMNFLDKPAIDPRKALAALPPLVKGYLRLGAGFGDGAVVDHQFGTTDILVVMPVAAIQDRYIAHFGGGTEQQDAA